jgi:predicted AAA+ superfamily ATPase
MLERDAMQTLVAWKNRRHRKPMLISGCRQCGKTFLAMEFGKRHFENTLVLNFERDPGLAGIFAANLDPVRILHEIGMLLLGKSIDPTRTLIIFDEIQQCTEAITSLKYFCESGLDLFIVCAGSLLGVELKRKNVSFPVGKTEHLRLYPLTFREFAKGLGAEKHLRLLEEFSLLREIPSALSEPMTRLLKLYYTLGGMPEVVQTYIDTEDISQADKVLERIISDLRNDFSHYADPTDILRINWIWDSVPKQLAKDNSKFVFSHVREGARSRDLEDALQWLVDAGLLYRLEKVSAPQVPLAACSDAASFKVYAHDVGILRRCSGISYRTIMAEQDAPGVFMGAVTENYCLTELIALGLRPYYWKNANTAEVDFLFEDELNRLIPLEAKTATHTKAKSFDLFCKRFSPAIGFKVSLRNVGENLKGRTREISLPLYLLWKLKKYLSAESEAASR